jgi:hypothetical protein
LKGAGDDVDRVALWGHDESIRIARYSATGDGGTMRSPTIRAGEAAMSRRKMTDGGSPAGR